MKVISASAVCLPDCNWQNTVLRLKEDECFLEVGVVSTSGAYTGHSADVGASSAEKWNTKPAWQLPMSSPCSSEVAALLVNLILSADWAFCLDCGFCWATVILQSLLKVCVSYFVVSGRRKIVLYMQISSKLTKLFSFKKEKTETVWSPPLIHYWSAALHLRPCLELDLDRKGSSFTFGAIWAKARRVGVWRRRKKTFPFKTSKILAWSSATKLEFSFASRSALVGFSAVLCVLWMEVFEVPFWIQKWSLISTKKSVWNQF